MEDEPRRLLRDLEVLRERRGGNALRMVRNQPNRHEPLAEWQLGVFEDRPDFDRKPLAALAALERAAVGEVIDLVPMAMGAELTIGPTDFAQMVNARLLVREGVHQVEQAVEIGLHGRSPILETPYPILRLGSNSYIGPKTSKA